MQTMRRRWSRAALAAGAAVLAVIRVAGAQTERVLTKPNARISHPFSSITGFRELADGRVMVSDGIDQVVLIADFSKPKLDTLGRSGQGPGEYKTPDALYGLPGDATLLVDLGNGRLSVFGPDGKYRESFPMTTGSPGAGSFSIIVPRATDKSGRLYYQPMGSQGGDSAVVLRWDRATKAIDTVGRVKLPVMVTKTSGGPNNRSVNQRPRPYPLQDGWAVTADGRVALLRAPEYRVDWVSTSRQLSKGKPIAVKPVAIGRPEKEEWVADQAANGLSVSMENRNGEVSMSFSRGRGRDDDAPKLDDVEWPASKPPFTGLTAAAPDGSLWIERSMPKGAARVFDLFSPVGELVMRVTLPVGRRLVAVGKNGVYARQVDDNDVSWLERYDWK